MKSNILAIFSGLIFAQIGYGAEITSLKSADPGHINDASFVSLILSEDMVSAAKPISGGQFTIQGKDGNNHLSCWAYFRKSPPVGAVTGYVDTFTVSTSDKNVKIDFPYEDTQTLESIYCNYDQVPTLESIAAVFSNNLSFKNLRSGNVVNPDTIQRIGVTQKISLFVTQKGSPFVYANSGSLSSDYAREYDRCILIGYPDAHEKVSLESNDTLAVTGTVRGYMSVWGKDTIVRAAYLKLGRTGDNLEINCESTGFDAGLPRMLQIHFGDRLHIEQ